MNNEIRRRALFATAKVALSFTVLGCGVGCSTVLVVDDAPDETPVVTEPREEETILDMPTTSAPDELVCGLPNPVPVTPQDDETLACCEEYVAPDMPEAGLGWDEWLAVAESDTNVPACCSVVIADSDSATGSSGAFEWEQLQACCAVLGSPAGPTCAPWGPPVPPTMAYDLVSLDQLLMLEPLAEVA